jgi:hypothetical protein
LSLFGLSPPSPSPTRPRLLGPPAPYSARVLYAQIPVQRAGLARCRKGGPGASLPRLILAGRREARTRFQGVLCKILKAAKRPPGRSGFPSPVSWVAGTLDLSYAAANARGLRPRRFGAGAASGEVVTGWLGLRPRRFAAGGASDTDGVSRLSAAGGEAQLLCQGGAMR